MANRGDDRDGMQVVRRVVEAVEAAPGDRVTAVYVLGSLAHGGFAPLVSDIDVALVLAGAVPGHDTVIERLAAAACASGPAAAARLSVFWGTPEMIEGREPGGRFPALDRLDLLRHGRLVWGTEARGLLTAPGYDELVQGTAAFAAGTLGLPDRLEEIRSPAFAASRGPRAASKVALLPVRFLYTAATGETGATDTAVDRYLGGRHDGRAVDLVRAAVRWRRAWGRREEEQARRLLAAGTRPLYREFAERYTDLLAQGGDAGARPAFAAWVDALWPTA